MKRCITLLMSAWVLPCEAAFHATWRCSFAVSSPVYIIISLDKLCLPYLFFISMFTSLLFLGMTLSIRAHFTPHLTLICSAEVTIFLPWMSAFWTQSRAALFNISKRMPIFCLDHLSVILHKTVFNICVSIMKHSWRMFLCAEIQSFRLAKFCSYQNKL